MAARKPKPAPAAGEETIAETPVLDLEPQPEPELPPMWVRFIRDVPNFTPPEDRRVTWAWSRGDERPLRRVHAEELIARGDAEAMDTPARGQA